MKKIKILLLSILLLLPFSLKAYVDNDNIIGYRYTDDFVINNKQNNYFDENGYLEIIRTSLISNRNNLNNANFLIGFTKDDIIAIIDYNTNGEFYFFNNVGNGFDRIEVNASTKNNTTSTSTYRYYYKLSDYSSVSAFINGIISGSNNRYLITNANGYRLFVSTGEDLRNRSYIWFDYNNDYFIPYYSTTNIKNNCFGSTCTHEEVAYIPFNIYGITDYVPTYYNLFGSVIPNNSLVPKLNYMYKNAFTIATSHITDNWNLSYTFNYKNQYSNIDHIDVYGLVNNNNIYYYENINDKVTINNYNWNCSNNSCTFSISNNDITYNNINNYEKIYFDIVYTSSINFIKDSFSFTRDNAYIIDVIVNDVCSNCLFLQLNSSGLNTYTFTSNTSNIDIFYSNILENDVAYNMPSYIDFNTNTINDDVIYVSNKYYYGVFNRILFNNIDFTNKTGLIMNIYQNTMKDIYNVSASYQVLYFISPNVKWSNSVYSTDRNNVNSCYEDNNNVICENIEGDFNNYYSEGTNVKSYFNIIKGLLSDDMYGLTGILLAPLNAMQRLVANDNVCTPLIIPLPFTNKNITIPCMSTYYAEHFGAILEIYHLVLYGIVCYGIGVSIFADLKNTLEADKNDIEVIKL